MSESLETTTPVTTETPPHDAESTSLVDTVFDLVTAWTLVGLRAAKVALEESARALTKTAQSIDTLAARFTREPHDNAQATPHA